MSFEPTTFKPKHFLWGFKNGVATITLNRPERKNPLTFESYDELRDTFRALDRCWDVKVVVIRGAGGNFCSGGDVHEIIGPLTKMDREGLLANAEANHAPEAVLERLQALPDDRTYQAMPDVWSALGGTVEHRF